MSIIHTFCNFMVLVHVLQRISCQGQAQSNVSEQDCRNAEFNLDWLLGGFLRVRAIIGRLLLTVGLSWFSFTPIGRLWEWIRFTWVRIVYLGIDWLISPSVH
jgi:hypothetical protein